MAAPWLGEALRAGDLPVIEEPGCMDRGTGGLFTPIGVLMHHTAGGANGNLPSLGIVRDGRSDLQGPLSQLMLARDGTFHFIAAGRANHAGVGSAWFVPGSDGNRYLIGIEAEATGVRDDWTPEQRVNYPRGVAALLRWMGKNELYAIGHKEWAPTRKVDPAFWDMNAFRADVRGWLNNPATDEEDDMSWLDQEARKLANGRGVTWRQLLLAVDDNIGTIRDKGPAATAAKVWDLAVPRPGTTPMPAGSLLGYTDAAASAGRDAAQAVEVCDEIAEIKDCLAKILEKLGLDEAA